MSGLRIGDVARRAGTTPRTIRYYEEIGLLPGADSREPGSHRLYDESDVDRLREVLQLKELLGVTLDELKALVEAEEARAGLRAEFHAVDDAARREAIMTEALGHIDRQMALLRNRRKAIEELETELLARRRRIRERLRRAS